MNIFDVINNELERMHEEREKWFKYHEAWCQVSSRDKGQSPTFSPGNQSFHTYMSEFLQKYLEVDQEIKSLRRDLFDQVKGYDEKIQEKIAELALTGKS